MTTVKDGLPQLCILLSDSKCADTAQGLAQLIPYAMSLRSMYLCFGLVMTHTKLSLQLFVPFKRKFSVITICSANCDSTSELESFFCAMYAALCRLIDDPIPADKLTHFMTPKCWCCSKELVCMESDDSHENLGHKSHETASLVIYCVKKK